MLSVSQKLAMLKRMPYRKKEKQNQKIIYLIWRWLKHSVHAYLLTECDLII